MKHSKLKVIGQMSGTSLDGLDLALCEFNFENDKVHFEFISGKTTPYDLTWKNNLENAYHSSAQDYFRLNYLYGKYMAEQILLFENELDIKADLIALHGHTVFHQPQNGFTTQIGCGATVCAHTNINTINSFRNMDVANGGQGAPLVPIGDRDLFSDFESCLNLGGIANLSFTKNKLTHAFDICLTNILLNYLAEQLGKRYDENGSLAAIGKVNEDLLHQLLIINYENKSIGREIFENEFLSVLKTSTSSIPDKLATCCEYSAIKISESLHYHKLSSVLVTGGGVYNNHLINRLSQHFKGKIEIPSDEIIQFKEAIIFSYLGFLAFNRQTNSLKEVTGAKKNSIGGSLHVASLPNAIY